MFYLGDRWFGVITASVLGSRAASYGFTSALPLAILKLTAPTLSDAIRARAEGPLLGLGGEQRAVSNGE